MLQMDIQAEKLHLIEQLARLQDTSIIQKIKDILQSAPQEEVAGYNPDGSAITQSDLINRAEASNQAIKEGRVTSLDDLEEESESW